MQKVVVLRGDQTFVQSGDLDGYLFNEPTAQFWGKALPVLLGHGWIIISIELRGVDDAVFMLEREN